MGDKSSTASATGKSFAITTKTFIHNVHSSVLRHKAKRKSAKKKKQTPEKRSKQIARFIMHFEMPNGKQLKDCTFAEVGTFGERYVKLRDMGEPDQKIGEVLSQKQVRAVLFV
jgi:hypothetical protein